MTTYAERLRKAMADSGVSVSQLAKQADITYQAAKKVFDGVAPSGFNSQNNFRVARFLRVSPEWLATGTQSTSLDFDNSHKNAESSEISAGARELAELIDMISDRITRAETLANCYAIALKALRSQEHQQQSPSD